MQSYIPHHPPFSRSGLKPTVAYGRRLWAGRVTDTSLFGRVLYYQFLHRSGYYRPLWTLEALLNWSPQAERLGEYIPQRPSPVRVRATQGELLQIKRTLENSRSFRPYIHSTTVPRFVAHTWSKGRSVPTLRCRDGDWHPKTHPRCVSEYQSLIPCHYFRTCMKSPPAAAWISAVWAAIGSLLCNRKHSASTDQDFEGTGCDMGYPWWLSSFLDLWTASPSWSTSESRIECYYASAWTASDGLQWCWRPDTRETSW